MSNNEYTWELIPEERWGEFEKYLSRIALARGVRPAAIYEGMSHNGRIFFAMKYIEKGKWVRYGVRYKAEDSLRKTWSDMYEMIKPLIGDNHAIEIYPRELDIVNTAPVRWFWVMPFRPLSKVFDLHG